MGFLTGENKDLLKQLAAEKENKELDADVNLANSAQQMVDANKVTMDAQVSSRILQRDERFLNYRIDYDKGVMIKLDRFDYVEPWGEEPICFLDGNKPNVIGEIDMLLSEIYANSMKYGDDLHNSFNELVRVRQSMMGISRATGKAPKVAKSQYVESNAFVRRDILPKKENKGLLGLGIMGL